MQLFICCVTYYGEYRHDTEPRVYAENAEEAVKKAFEWCKGMNEKALQIRAYPYVKGLDGA